MKLSVEGKHAVMRFDSVDQLRHAVAGEFKHAPIFRHFGEYDDYFGEVSNFSELMELSRNGWEKDVKEMIAVAEDTIETVEKEFDVQAWNSIYDVTGSDVDVDRYLSGEPENMISFVMMDTPRVGRVVTLVVNISASCAVDAETITARGKNVVALVHALETLGIRTELYVDAPAKALGWGGDSKITANTIVKIKDAQDTLDAAMVMFAFAHPAFLRALILPSMHGFPREYQEAMGVGSSYGQPSSRDNSDEYPDGTIRLDTEMPGRWTPQQAKTFVVDHLKQLGII